MATAMIRQEKRGPGRRYSAQERTALLAGFEQFGGSLYAYAKRTGFTLLTLQRWLQHEGQVILPGVAGASWSSRFGQPRIGFPLSSRWSSLDAFGCGFRRSRMRRTSGDWRELVEGTFCRRRYVSGAGSTVTAWMTDQAMHFHWVDRCRLFLWKSHRVADARCFWLEEGAPPE